MRDIGVAQAAMNNAAWCDAVCSAHGSPGRFCESHWISRDRVPPLYPNLVTLSRTFEPDMASLQEVQRVEASTSWAVKDSFHCLRLERAGFHILFSAEWILRPSTLERPDRSPKVCWFRVQSETELAAWEAAWGESHGAPRVFLPTLLRRSEIAILGVAGAGGSIAAGVIANRTDDAVGLSNLFLHATARNVLHVACVEAAMQTFPGLPLVSYESGRDLAGSKSLGFQSLGPMRVWIRGVAPEAAAQQAT